MIDRRIGLAIRRLRRRRGWRQRDLALAAGLSQQLVSLVERGHLDRVALRSVRAIAAAVDAFLVSDLRWRGGGLDRLLDEDHAGLVGVIVAELRGLGWRVEVEVSFSHFGERGSIDILALHPISGALLVIEIKTQLASIEEMLRTLDVKTRLAPAIARGRFGEAPRSVSRLVVLTRSATNYRQVARHESVLGAALPDRAEAVKGWLRNPVGTISGLRVVAVTNPRGVRGGRGGPDRVQAADSTRSSSQRTNGVSE